MLFLGSFTGNSKCWLCLNLRWENWSSGNDAYGWYGISFKFLQRPPNGLVIRVILQVLLVTCADILDISPLNLCLYICIHFQVSWAVYSQKHFARYCMSRNNIQSFVSRFQFWRNTLRIAQSACFGLGNQLHCIFNSLILLIDSVTRKPQLIAE